MRHHLFTQADSYSIALLIKTTSFNKQELKNSYVDPLVQRGIPEASLIAFTLEYNDTGKAPVKFIKDYLDKLLPALHSLGVTQLYVADSHYFKVLAGMAKAETHHGYVLPCKIKGFEHMTVVLGINYQAMIYNPELKSKLELGLHAIATHAAGTYEVLGGNIIHSAHYPESLQDIAAALQSLHQYPTLEMDIEGFSLRFNEAGIATISAAWDKHNGLAFACDYKQYSERPAEGYYGWYGANREVRTMLKEFFTTYKGVITWHNAAYDLKAIIYALWMEDLLDTKGMLDGLDIMCANMDDTKIIAYLATNSTAGNDLRLKMLAHEFAGNWAIEEIKDIRKVSLPELLRYNLVDSLSTNYVREKYFPIMVRDNQEELYRTFMLPCLKMMLQMEMTGMPMSAERVQAAKHKLEAIQKTHLDIIQYSGVIKTLNLLVQNKAMVTANAKLKVKQHPLSAFDHVEFNPNSGPQLQELLYGQMGLPVLDYTETKQPATGADTIEKLIHHTDNTAYKELLAALIGYGSVSKILNTFIPAFEKAIAKGDGIVWLHGNFNLNGTVSGRLSSSDPNLQNIPATSEYGKLIKECFVSPDGWIFAGADFSSLEDKISALTTRDENKLRVYTQGYDGHSLRAFYYFADQMPDLVQEMALLPTDRVFKVISEDGSLYYAKGSDIIQPFGNTVEEHYATNKRL